MLAELKNLLNYLEDNIDHNKIVGAEQRHRQSLNYEDVDRLPLIATYPYPEDAKFAPFPHGQIFDDPEKMLFNQFVNAFDTSTYLGMSLNDDLPITIRADFGCVLTASVFGAEVRQVGDNPPWIVHNREISYESILETESVDFDKGWTGKATERYSVFVAILKDYPGLHKVTNVVLPDLQGPIDNLELIRGSSLFLEMYSEKELFLKAMDVVTDRQIELAKHFSKFTNSRIDGFCFQHGFALKGDILLRNDISIMVSPEMYTEMIAPFDQQILEELGGGIHSCGDISRIIPEYLSLKSIECFDFGQSELNDVESIYPLAGEKQIPLMRIGVTEEELTSGSVLKKYPTGVSLIFRAKSFDHARKVCGDYKESTI